MMIKEVHKENITTRRPTPRRVIGDVNFQAVSKIVAAISPVPGGVGPMTIVSLFENLVDVGEINNH